MDQKVAQLLNEQINKEFYSAYLYLDIANWYADQDLDGFANWYNIQAQEERTATKPPAIPSMSPTPTNSTSPA